MYQCDKAAEFPVAEQAALESARIVR